MAMDNRSFNDLTLEEQDDLIQQLLAVRAWNDSLPPADLSKVKTRRGRA